MSELNPYRTIVSPSWEEEELWQRLDEALELSLRDNVMAWGLAWSVVRDAMQSGHRAVEAAAVSLLNELTPGGLTIECFGPRRLLPITSRDVAAMETDDEH